MAKRQEEAPPALNMTPMIDVVFNLVIFFLIVTDLTQKELELLTLPLADKAKEDKAAEDQERVIINLCEKKDAPGTYVAIVKRREMDHKALKAYLKYRASSAREEKSMVEGLEPPSKIYVLIRADRSTPWQQVQWIMQDCADPDVLIWKLQFATREQQEG
jgi:biopolymer transport protein ExbD